MVKLSPPWYTLQREFVELLAKDPEVVISELRKKTSSNFSIVVTVNGDAKRGKAAALASILATDFEFGKIRVEILVQDGDGSIVGPKIPQSEEDLAEIINTALQGNPWFRKAVVVTFEILPTKFVYAVFAKEVVQFFDDDINDLYNNYNNVAAFAFREILDQNPGGIQINCSTEQL